MTAERYASCRAVPHEKPHTDRRRHSGSRSALPDPVRSRRLRTRADALPVIPDADTPGLLDGLETQFNRYETGLSLSVSFPILDRVREQIAAARAYAVSGSDTDYAAALAVLREALNDLDRLERFSVRNIM